VRKLIFCWMYFSCVQVLPLVPPGRKANEEGSPYSGQVTLIISTSHLFSVFLSYCFCFLLACGGGVEKIECIVQWMNEMYNCKYIKEKEMYIGKKCFLEVIPYNYSSILRNGFTRIISYLLLLLCVAICQPYQLLRFSKTVLAFCHSISMCLRIVVVSFCF
jgi:hypothetical protein